MAKPRPPQPPPPMGGGMRLPKPGKALTVVLVSLLALWVVFAVAINWGGASEQLFFRFVGNTQLVLRGEVWRLFTAPFMHKPAGDGAIGHIIMVLLGLYFLTPSLEAKWGGKKLLAFLYGAAVVAFITQMIADVLFPTAIGQRSQFWYGAVPAVEAVAIAWAMSFRGRQVMLMFVLPVSSTMLVVFVVGMAVLRLLTASHAPEGLIAPFGAMLYGWLVGGSPSPLRTAWLKWRLRNMQKKAASKSARFRMIEGGAKDERPSKPDKNMLN